jgi:preprotein translocase subunit SecG
LLGAGHQGAMTVATRRDGSYILSRRSQHCLQRQLAIAPDRIAEPPLASRTPRLYAEAMETILSVLQVVIAVVLIFLVLMHSGKDSGLSGAFGVGSGTGPLGGGSMVERNLNRWTVFFAIVFVLNTIVLLKKLA